MKFLKKETDKWGNEFADSWAKRMWQICVLTGIIILSLMIFEIISWWFSPVFIILIFMGLCFRIMEMYAKACLTDDAKKSWK